MSAYLCDDKHITQLAAYLCAGRTTNLGWIAQRVGYPNDTQPKAHELATHIANIMLAENYRSLDSRYGDNDEPHTVEVGVHLPMHMYAVDAGKIAKSVRCYEYQSCESSDWEDTIAHRICRMIYMTALERIPSYEDAEWGAPLKLDRMVA